MSDEKKERKIERSTTLEFENGEKVYLFERDENDNLFINGQKLVVKTSIDKFNKEEQQTYDEAKLIENEDPKKKKRGYALIKVSLCYAFLDEELFPDIKGDGVIFGIVDAIILRLFSNETYQSKYFFNKSCWTIEALLTDKWESLPTTGSDMVDTDFEKLIADLE
jgi:hypothetical protein